MTGTTFATAKSTLPAWGLEAIKPLWQRVRVERVRQAVPGLAGDRSRAREIYAGRFHLAGLTVDCRGRSIFAAVAPSADFTHALHGFDWLADLQSSGRMLERVHARALVGEWIARKKFHPKLARSRAVRAARLKNWAIAAPFLTDGASLAFQTQFLQAVGSEISHLLLPSLKRDLAETEALAISLEVFAGLEAFESLIQSRLAKDLSRAWPDGFAPSRNPAEIALKLLQVSGPAVRPLFKALGLLTMSDGGLAALNGMNIAEKGFGRGPLGAFARGGFARLAAGEACVILDGGSHFALEFSSGPVRLVTQCGTPGIELPRWKGLDRLVGAHSAPGLGDEPAVFGAVEVQAERSADGLSASARCPGFERRLHLSRDGRSLRGEDRLLAQASGRPLVLRFHLDPDSEASLSDDGRGVLIVQGVQIWSFTARGASFTIEDSVSLTGLAQPRLCRQIVLSMAEPDLGNGVHWAFRRVA